MDEEERTRRAEELRQVILQRCAKDARKAFKNYQPLRSVGLLVAQYWDDEADDAVPRPLPEAALGRGDAHSNERDRVNLPSFSKKRSPPYISAPWGPNGGAIPTFAAYCTEGGDQCSPAKDTYALYAIFLRDGRDKTVGAQLRPHLDGHPEESLMQNLARLSQG